jgi:4-phosphopantoate--beta-alanine ligase
VRPTRISSKHPRAASLRVRERLVEQFNNGVVAAAGLLAQGRGEAFDYLLGEKTTSNALEAMKTAAAMLLVAKHPIISVNGNAAALAAEDIVKLAKAVNAKIEVNLFHRSVEREKAIKKLLEQFGARQVLGVGKAPTATISDIASNRRRVDPRGILIADVVLVPLEDGDRTEALVEKGKKVIAIDLNPLSRTARFANVTIVDNMVRAVPTLTKIAKELNGKNTEDLKEIVRDFDNKQNLSEAITLIEKRLQWLAERNPSDASHLTFLEEESET